MSTNPVHAALSEAVDIGLLDIMKNGRIVRDAEGNIVLGSDGQPLRERPSAADYNAAIRRLTSLGISKQINANSPAALLLEQMKARGLKFGNRPPPVDTENDDAATEVA